MSRSTLDRLRERAYAVRTRAAVRHWRYRQRHLTAGVWFRLRRVLSDARVAYVISEDDARRLVMKGYTPEACGLRMAPEKTILFVDEHSLANLETRQIPVGLGPEFLAARAIALIPFDASRPRSTTAAVRKRTARHSI